MSDQSNRPLIRKKADLVELLQAATPDELNAIVDILLQKSNDQFFQENDSRLRLRMSHVTGDLSRRVNDIAHEIRALGSVRVANFFRGGEPVSYDEIVRDVAKELDITFNKDETTYVIEQMIRSVMQEVIEATESEETEVEETAAMEQADNKVEQPSKFSKLIKNNPLGSSMAAFAVGKKAMETASVAVARAKLVKASALEKVVGGAVVGAELYKKFRNKQREELRSLAVIVNHIAGIRAALVEADQQEFTELLKGCL